MGNSINVFRIYFLAILKLDIRHSLVMYSGKISSKIFCGIMPILKGRVATPIASYHSQLHLSENNKLVNFGW